MNPVTVGLVVSVISAISGLAAGLGAIFILPIKRKAELATAEKAEAEAHILASDLAQRRIAVANEIIDRQSKLERYVIELVHWQGELVLKLRQQGIEFTDPPQMPE